MNKVMRFNMVPTGQPNPSERGLYVRHEDYDAIADDNQRLLAALKLANHWCKSALESIRPYQENAQPASDTIHDVGCFLRHQSADLHATLSAKP